MAEQVLTSPSAIPAAPAENAPPPATRLARTLGALALATAIVIPLLLFAVSAVQQWRATRTATLERLDHARDLFRAHAIRILQTQRQLAAAVGDRIGPLSDAEIAGSSDLQVYLEQLRPHVAEVRAIWVFDAAGRALASNLGFPAPPRSVADQPFFRALREGREPLAVSTRFPASAGRSTFFSIGLPVRGAQQQFTGAVVMDIDPGSFQQLRGEVPGGVFELIGADGALLVHLPEDASAPATLPSDAFVMRQLALHDEGTAEGPAGPDNQDALLSYGRLEGFPIYVSVGIGTEDVRRLWLEHMAWQALYFIPATLVLAGVGWIAWRNQRRLAAANAELARVNASLETSIADGTNDLTRALAEKDLLIEEVHHRVKNNMQVISSLVGLQTRMGDSAEQTTRRIHAMSLVHELIYGSGSLEGLDLAHYIQRLCENLRPLTPKGVKLDLDLEPVRIPLERAVPVALVLNETLTNIMLTGFEPEEQARIGVHMRAVGEQVELEVGHTGSRAAATDKIEGLAGRLIEGLVAQIQGKMTRTTGSDRPVVHLVFPLARQKRAV